MGSKKTSLLLIMTMLMLRKSLKFDVKATSHSTIFDIPMRPLREDQKHRHRFTR